MLLGNDKKKKHGGYAAVIGALAMYGAYRVINGMKNAVFGGASAMSSGIKKLKNKMPMMNSSETVPKEDDEPYDG